MWDLKYKYNLTHKTQLSATIVEVEFLDSQTVKQRCYWKEHKLH